MTEPDPAAAWWNDRYASRPTLWGKGPNRFVAEAFEGLPPRGRALDLGCGEGRNAVWLAEQGWQATGVDFSSLALERGRQLALERGVEVAYVEADVTTWEAPEPFDLIVVAYLHLLPEQLSEVWPRLARALSPGGEVFLIGHARRNLSEGVGGPQDPDRLWEPSELAGALSEVGLEVTLSEEVLRPVEDKAAIDARLRARRAPG
jgi:SAM-dependent methyltransferase